MINPKPIPFCHFGGYRPCCRWWWSDLLEYLTGICFDEYLHEYANPSIRFRLPGWVQDIYTYWHRARYGWAPGDVWSLDAYLCSVLAGSLEHLAEHKNGSPAGYPDGGETTNHDLWQANLKRWAQAFRENPNDVAIYDEPNYEKHRAEETRCRENLHKALREMEPWFEALWD